MPPVMNCPQPSLRDHQGPHFKAFENCVKSLQCKTVARGRLAGELTRWWGLAHTRHISDSQTLFQPQSESELG